MDRMILDQMLGWFQDWVYGMMTESGEEMESFYNQILEHTYRVRQHAVTLGKTEKMSEQSLMLLELSCLFHDLGRFRELYLTRQGMMPSVNNHGETGVALIEKLPLMDRLTEEEHSILYHAILHHNDYKCPENLDPTVLHYLKILRDADKLDAFYKEFHRSKAKSRRHHEDTEEGVAPYSKELVTELMAGRSIHADDIKYPLDKLLMLLGYLYDLNYSNSFWVIMQYQYVDLVLDKMPQDEAIESLRELLTEFVVKQLTKE